MVPRSYFAQNSCVKVCFAAFARAGCTPDGAYDPEKRSNKPESATQSMQLKLISEIGQNLDI